MSYNPLFLIAAESERRPKILGGLVATSGSATLPTFLDNDGKLQKPMKVETRNAILARDRGSGKQVLAPGVEIELRRITKRGCHHLLDSHFAFSIQFTSGERNKGVVCVKNSQITSSPRAFATIPILMACNDARDFDSGV